MQRILVVDDAVTVRMYHRHLLEALGFAVDEAENGIEGLERALSGDHALYLVDVNMPKMDGYAFVGEIRRNPDLHAVPVVMISTEAGEHDRERAFAAGANDYVVKPVQPRALQERARLLAGGA